MTISKINMLYNMISTLSPASEEMTNTWPKCNFNKNESVEKPKEPQTDSRMHVSTVDIKETIHIYGDLPVDLCGFSK